MALPSSFFLVFLFCWLVIGSGGGDGDAPSQVIDERHFYRGNLSLIGNVVSSLTVNATFPGFNFSGHPAVPGSGVSRNEWSWTVNVTDIEVGDGSSIISQTTHTLRFPEQAFPNQNATDWTACAYTILEDFPLNLTSRAKTNDGSCSEVLGDACLAELTRGLQDSSPNRPKFPLNACPFPPFWFQLPECRNWIGLGYNYRPRMFWFSEPSTSTVPPRTLTVPLALMNLTTGSLQDPLDTTSLYSNEVYWSERSVVHSKSDSIPFKVQADREQFMMLLFAPSNEWIWNHYGFPLNNTRVLPMCLRVLERNHTYEPTTSLVESSAAVGAQLALP